MRTILRGTLALVVALGAPTLAAAQRQADTDAINQLIDRYGALEDAMDMAGQAQLMSPDRVWIGQGQGRRTDQAANMRIQQAGMDQLEAMVPGIKTITEDRDRVIRFYGNGSVAVASFYRYTTTILPPDTPPDIAVQFQPTPPGVVTLVIEKRDGGWKIVHTHFSNLVPAGN